MTDNEIIKALEGCWLEGNCEYCPMKKDNKCKAILRQIALDLINRQQAEIERKEKELEAFAKWDKEYQDKIYELRKALLSKENLEESFSKSVKQFDKKLAKTVNLERTESIKEFAERLKESKFDVDVSFGYGREVYTEAVAVVEIDNLVKEMVGDAE